MKFLWYYHVLLCSNWPLNEVKIGKLPNSFATYVQLYFKTNERWKKYGGFLLNCTIPKLPLTVSFWKHIGVDFKIDSVLLLLSHQQARKVNEFLYTAIKKWEQLQLTHNSKFVEGQGNYYDKTQKLFKITRVQVIKYEFL